MEPQQDKKGHVFCRRCIEKHLTISNQCPVEDHEISKDKIDSILFIINILEKQTVFCKNRNRECEWKGNLKLLEPHLFNECEKQDLNCPNEGCQVKIMRQDLSNHLENCDYRLVKCRYCMKDICLQKMNLHYNDCPQYPLVCIQLCGKMVQRCDMENHIKNNCDNTLLKCPYEKFGCVAELMKKDLSTHLMETSDEHNFAILTFQEKFQHEVIETISKVKSSSDLLNEKINQISKKMDEYEGNNDVLGKKAPPKNPLTNWINDVKNVKKKKLDESDNKLIYNY